MLCWVYGNCQGQLISIQSWEWWSKVLESPLWLTQWEVWLIKHQRCRGRKLEHFTPTVSFPGEVTNGVREACRNSCAEETGRQLSLFVSASESDGVRSARTERNNGGHLPAPWPRWGSPPRRRSWNWPRWWTGSPPTQTCLPAPAAASSGNRAPEHKRTWRVRQGCSKEVGTLLHGLSLRSAWLTLSTLFKPLRRLLMSFSSSVMLQKQTNL